MKGWEMKRERGERKEIEQTGEITEGKGNGIERGMEKHMNGQTDKGEKERHTEMRRKS